MISDNSENKDTQNNPLSLGGGGITSPEKCVENMEETAVLQNKCDYPGTPLDDEAKNIKLPGCKLLSVLGVGGMGCVYLGRQTNLNRLVAVKALKVHVANDPKLREWLKNEAVTLGAINHPNIVSCHDVVYSHGQIFLIMEYVPGFMSVASLVKKFGPMPEDIVMHIMLEVIDALAYVYGKGFIHRDIKPHNILVYNERKFQARNIRELFKDDDTRIKLCDFGIAVKAFKDAVKTQGSTIVQGSPNYMAPEQIVAPDSIDFKADMYALAGTATFMLTGKPPFQFDNANEIFAYKLENDIPRLDSSSIKNTTFAKIIARMGSANPDDRYDSYAELKRELETIQPSVEKSSGFRKMRFWKGLSISLAFILGLAAYFFGKDYIINNYFRVKSISLSSTLGYWQGDRTGWYVWQMPSSSGKVPVLIGDDISDELKLVQLVEPGKTLSFTTRRKNPGFISFKLNNANGNDFNLRWHCDAQGNSIFYAAGSGNNKNRTDGILPLDKNGWYKIQFKIYRKNLMVFINNEPVYTGSIKESTPFNFALDASHSGNIMLKNINITDNE